MAEQAGECRRPLLPRETHARTSRRQNATAAEQTSATTVRRNTAYALPGSSDAAGFAAVTAAASNSCAPAIVGRNFAHGVRKTRTSEICETAMSTSNGTRA
ncbi:hypothetical protein ACFPRL_10650 [Pseudoclavibacter helvolus]